jgi:hypothetical protein
MKIAYVVGTLSLLVGCSGGGSSSAHAGDSGPPDDAGGSSSGGGSGSSGGSSSGSDGNASGGSSSSGGGSTEGGSSGSSSSGASSGGEGGGVWAAGNPDGTCTAGVPAEGAAADSSHPTTVVGTGTAASCTFALLSAAVTKGGVITFDCGGAVTIPVTSTLDVPTGMDTVIDGNRLVTLDGQGTTQIMSFNSPGWQTNTHRLTLQHLAFVNAKTTPTDAIPMAPAPCSQGWDDGQGGAVYMRDGNLTVVDCIFTGNHAAPLGPDTGGGAIYVQGSLHGLVIAGSTFEMNEASNAGAVGGLFCEEHIYTSLFTHNTAIGSGANNADMTMCSVMNNGQYEIGSGGNGGAIYSDGNSVNIILCGDEITDNSAGTGAFGGGLFFTSNNMAGTLSITDTTMTGNTGGHWTNVSTGSITNAGSAVGTNCKSITLQNSTLQGYP